MLRCGVNTIRLRGNPGNLYDSHGAVGYCAYTMRQLSDSVVNLVCPMSYAHKIIQISYYEENVGL